MIVIMHDDAGNPIGDPLDLTQKQIAQLELDLPLGWTVDKPEES